MQFPRGREHYSGDYITRLNVARAGIWHATKCLKCSTVYLPVYQCETVRSFLISHGLTVKYYRIDSQFNPLLDNIEEGSSIVLANYFGVMSNARMKSLALKFENVIIDNAQAFFAPSIDGCMNVYSARKFVGTPDGCYVVGSNANYDIDSYPQDYSSDTALFLLQRIEYGCAGKAYDSRKQNELRLDSSVCMRMSKLTKTILSGTDYDKIIIARRTNFQKAHELFGAINGLYPLQYYDETCVPMVYPLVVENDTLLNRLQNAGHYQGHWWTYLLYETEPGSFEHFLSRYIIPITIDQRYSERDLMYIREVCG